MLFSNSKQKFTATPQNLLEYEVRHFLGPFCGRRDNIPPMHFWSVRYIVWHQKKWFTPTSVSFPFPQLLLALDGAMCLWGRKYLGIIFRIIHAFHTEEEWWPSGLMRESGSAQSDARAGDKRHLVRLDLLKLNRLCHPSTKTALTSLEISIIDQVPSTSYSCFGHLDK